MRCIAMAAALLGLALNAAPAAAQGYPTKQVNYIIPFNAGGESDITARLQQPVWERMTGKNLVIQYLEGAGGAQAWSQLNGMAGDGSVIMGTNLPHLVLQPMAQKSGYRTEDITNVYFFQYTPDAIIVAAKSEFKTLQDLVDCAKKNPGAVTFSGSGTNSANNVAKVKFDNLAKVITTYIPFSGTNPATTAVLGSQVMAGFSYSTAAINQGEALRVLAIASEKRLPSFPDVPTFKELGLDMVGGAYRGVGVPKSTPEAIRTQVSDLIGQINHDPAFVKKMEDGGFALVDVPYSGMAAFMQERQQDYQAIAKQMGLAQK